MEHERRRAARFSVQELESVFRQCDLTVTSARVNRDAVIENISRTGVCLRFDDPADLSGVEPGQEIFIHGCVFNSLVGFLSSAKGVVRWVNGAACGLLFDGRLDVTSDDLREALGLENEYLRDYAV